MIQAPVKKRSWLPLPEKNTKLENVSPIQGRIKLKVGPRYFFTVNVRDLDKLNLNSSFTVKVSASFSTSVTKMLQNWSKMTQNDYQISV
jgi:hypothetical protein